MAHVSLFNKVDTRNNVKKRKKINFLELFKISQRGKEKFVVNTRV